MKVKLFYVFIFISSFLCSAAAYSYNQAITTDPLDLFNADRFNIKYESMLGTKNSWTAELVYDYNYENTLGLSVGGAYRWYLRSLLPVKSSGIEGLSVAPYVRLGWYRHELNENTYESDICLDFGGEIAYKWVVWGGFAIEPIIRLGFGVGASYYKDGFNPWPGVSIGYAW